MVNNDFLQEFYVSGNKKMDISKNLYQYAKYDPPDMLTMICCGIWLQESAK